MPIRLPVLIVSALIAPSLAHAAERSVAVEGTALAVETPCAKHVDISPDPGLHGQVTVTATASHQEELDRLLIDQHGGVRVHTVPAGCWQSNASLSFDRSLSLRIRIPTRAAVSIEESGAGSYTVGDTGAGLKLDLSGAADVQAGQVTGLTAELSGHGSVRIAGVDGPAKVSISGQGDVAIVRAAIPALSVDISGAGSLAIFAGAIGNATLEESGLGSIRIDAPADSATVDLSGAGSVRLAQVKQLHKDVSGLGSVTVGGQ